MKDGSSVSIAKSGNTAEEYRAIPLEKLNERVRYLENYDTITGLPNRTLFIEKVSETILLQPVEGSNNAILTVDLDDFRKHNDTYGYLVRDELLRVAASKLKSCLRDKDFIARIGGDEFFILLAGFETIEDVVRISERILSSLNAIWKVLDHEFYMSATIGIAMIPEGKTDVADLLRDATSALYEAKKKGKNQYQFHEKGTHEKLIHLFRMENSLRGAVERNEIVVHYQPQVHAETGQIFRMEALVRWQHRHLGMLLPSRFIPLAENTGLIIPIGNRVIELVCEHNMRWKELGYGTFPISVNVSAKQLQQDSFVSFIQDVLDRTGMPPACLEMEITESAIVRSMNTAVYALNQLRELGIKISLDDFGTGYSSLSYLKTLPVDKIKIDRSFITDIGKNPKTEAIITAIIVLAKTMNLDVIAEGVETDEQADFVMQKGCSDIQGFLYSAALPEEQFTLLLSERQVFPSKNPCLGRQRYSATEVKKPAAQILVDE